MSATPDTDTHSGDLLVVDTADRVIAELHDQASLSPETATRVVGLARRFERFVTVGCGVRFLSEVTAEHVRAFVVAATVRDGRQPSVATMRLRRWTVRLFFRVARELELTTNDPTRDLELPGRTSRSLRPLTDAEIARCRWAALPDLSTTRLSTAWALGEATARTSEIPHLRVCDLDLHHDRIWIHGSPHTGPRWGRLTEWGLTQLERRVAEVGRTKDSDGLLAGPSQSNRESRVSRSAQALRETLTRAGLEDVERVGPGSLAAWAGVQAFNTTHRIEVVALALGVNSLDSAARLIDWNWRLPVKDGHA